MTKPLKSVKQTNQNLSWPWSSWCIRIDHYPILTFCSRFVIPGDPFSIQVRCEVWIVTKAQLECLRSDVARFIPGNGGVGGPWWPQFMKNPVKVTKCKKFICFFRRQDRFPALAWWVMCIWVGLSIVCFMGWVKNYFKLGWAKINSSNQALYMVRISWWFRSAFNLRDLLCHTMKHHERNVKLPHLWL